MYHIFYSFTILFKYYFFIFFSLLFVWKKEILNERDSIERDMREGERGKAKRDGWLRVKRKIFLCKREKVQIKHTKKKQITHLPVQFYC